MPDCAERLHTRLAVIDALERGDFRRLPPWPETVVVVSGFTALAGIDPRPVLTAIRAELETKIIDARIADALPSRSQPSPAPAAASKVTPGWPALQKTIAEGVASGQRGARVLAKTGIEAASKGMDRVRAAHGNAPQLANVRLPGRTPVAVSLAVTLSLVLMVTFGTSGALQAAVSGLPEPISGAFRSFHDYLLHATSTKKNGLVWIDVSDPRSRKTDKLPGPRR